MCVERVSGAPLQLYGSEMRACTAACRQLLGEPILLLKGPRSRRILWTDRVIRRSSDHGSRCGESQIGIGCRKPIRANQSRRKSVGSETILRLVSMGDEIRAILVAQWYDSSRHPE